MSNYYFILNKKFFLQMIGKNTFPFTKFIIKKLEYNNIKISPLLYKNVIDRENKNTWHIY